MTATRRFSMLISLLVTLPLPCAARQVSALWLTAYGDNGAVEHMKFGNRSGNTFGVDSTQPGEYKELEPPPPSPGFDCIWVLPPGRAGQWGSFRGLLRYDWRSADDLALEARRDTWAVRFAQNDNPAAQISFKWPGALCLLYECDSIFLIDPTGAIGWPNNKLDMTTTDTLDIPEAGERGINRLRIVKYNIDHSWCEEYPCFSFCQPVDVADQGDLPASPSLSENYPNPFNPSTTVDVDVPSRSPGSLRVYDLLGREVETIFEGELEPGRHRFSWDGAGRAGGIYVARLSTGLGILTRKLLLSK